MKRTLGLLAVLALLLMPACHGNRASYNTLAVVGNTATAAYSGYMDMVVKGQVATNPVPRVATTYNTFQGAYGLAVTAAQFNLTNLAPDNVLNLLSNLLVTIDNAKGLK